MDPYLTGYEGVPSDPYLMEYLLGREDYPHIDLVARPKRRWWGNKYKDNKSYGFWITALNKAGNKRKRGKREAPFVPALSPGKAGYSPFAGQTDYSDIPE